MTAGLDVKACNRKSVTDGVTKAIQGKRIGTNCRDGKVVWHGKQVKNRVSAIRSFEGCYGESPSVGERKLIGKSEDGTRSEKGNRQRPVTRDFFRTKVEVSDIAERRRGQERRASLRSHQSCMSCCCWSLPTLLSFSLSSWL
jgi:hypothetical protein